MKKEFIIYLTFVLFNGPLATALASETNQRSSFFRGKSLASLGKKIKKKTRAIKEVLPESISLSFKSDEKGDVGTGIADESEEIEEGAAADKLSISLFLSDLKERTGDLSQMVRDFSNLVFGYTVIVIGSVQNPLDARGGGGVQGVTGKTNKYSKFRPFSQEKKNDYTEKLPWLDLLGRKFCLWTGCLVSLQSFSTILSNYDFAFVDEIADRLLSKESAMAVKTIRKIIYDFPEYGVIDIFSLYPTKDVVASILALSRLQRAAQYGASTLNNERDKNGVDFLSAALSLPSYDESDGHERDCDDIVTNERELLEDLAHYSTYAHAVYGWKFGLLSGRVHLGDKAMLLRKTGIKRHHLIYANWKSKTHLPAHFLVRDVRRKKIVLCIRGTLSPKDVLTDLCCTAEEFLSHEEEMREKMNETGTDMFRSGFRSKQKARAHQGMLQSARGVAGKTRKLIASELVSKPDYDLVIVGHSLGGGVAAVLASLWEDTFPGLKVYAYGCPCVGPADFYPSKSTSIVSVVGEGDPFSCLSLGHLADASLTLSMLCKDKDLRETILDQTKVDVEDLEEDELKWCIEKMDSLQADMNAEKFYPPGRLLHMKGNLFGGVDEVTLSEVERETTFGMLRLHPRMFDLSLHIPHRYEVLLARIWATANKRNS